MLKLHEEITVPRSPEECFRYIADFRTTLEWDATAVAAEKITPGPVGTGTVFALRCKAGPGTVAIDYEVEEHQPWHSLVLVGRSRFFDVRDTIVMTEVENGTHIDYTAEFTFHLGLEKLAKLRESSMHKMGERSLEGLRKALTDNNPPPEISACTAKADQWVWPGVAMFSKWGFRRGRKHWQPVSQSMHGKHVVLTGATAGLGRVTATALAEAGATLTLVIRKPEMAEPLRNALIEETGNENIRIELADLGLLSEVDALIERLLSRQQPIDVLINNAGALFNEYAKTDEDIERSLALLLLSPWRLTEGLRPLLANHETPARVVNVVSGGMYTERLSLKRLEMTPDDYNGPRAYARAKRALTVMTEYWAEQWREDNIVVNAMHPGWADTPGVQGALPTFRSITRLILRSPEEGADTIVWLARASEADQVTGKLFLDREPRTTYLNEKTREKPEDRAQLPDWLQQRYQALNLS